jgi:hypothetical protein
MDQESEAYRFFITSFFSFVEKVLIFVERYLVTLLISLSYLGEYETGPNQFAPNQFLL